MSESILLLPQAPEIERAVLGAFLKSPTEIGSKMSARGFPAHAMHIPANRTILQVLMDMWRNNRPIDLLSATDELATKGHIQAIGGYFYITSLTEHMPSLAMADSYLKTLEEKHALREVIATSSKYNNLAYQGVEDVDEFVREFVSHTSDIGKATTVKPARSMKSLLKDKMHRMTSDELPSNVILTGLSKLDKESPMHRGDMPVISGETKAGKTILALTIAGNIAVNGGMPVLYFSLEDSADQPIDRLIAGLSRVPIDHHHKTKISQGGFDRVSKAIEDLAKSNLTVRDDVYELSQIVDTSRQFVAKYPTTGAIIVDYAQLVVAHKKGMNREQEIATISRTLRILGLELQVPIIVLSQLNKEGDTRESKALEQDTTAHWKVTMADDDPNKRILVIPRQRNSQSGISFPLSFFGHLARFDNYAYVSTDS